MRVYVGAVLSALLALQANATGPSSPESKAVTYTVQEGSQLKWLATKVGGQHDGTVALKGGTFEWDGKTIQKGRFEIAMDTIKVDDIKDPAYNAKLVTHLKSDDFFSADKFKVGTYEITKVTPKSNNEFDIEGKLTIKGKTESLNFPATVQQEGDMLKVNGKAKLDRTLWGIKYKSGKYVPNLGDKLIHDVFSVDLNLSAAKLAAATTAPAKKQK